MQVKYVLLLCALVGFFVSSGCDYPYTPDREEPLEVVSANPNLTPINGGAQICNPSISQNTTDYNGCMLLLNFAGIMAITIPQEFENEFPALATINHDRLTIVDTNNTLAWFTMRPSYIGGQFQDPEWSTHPDYIVSLGQDASRGEARTNWDGYIIRLQDKAFLRFCQDKMNVEATPHVWIESDSSINPGAKPADSAKYATTTYDSVTGFVDTGSVRNFLGTRNVKIVWSDGGNLKYLDYSQSSPTIITIPKPANPSAWNVEDPLISPDGNWVVYNYKSSDRKNEFASFAQRLEETALPVQIGLNASDPHWWVHPETNDFYVIYATYAENGGFIQQQFISGETDDGSVGSTWFLKLDISGSGTTALADWTKFTDAPVKLVDFPFRGGLSPDARFLCTGYKYAYLYDLN